GRCGDVREGGPSGLGASLALGLLLRAELLLGWCLRLVLALTLGLALPAAAPAFAARGLAAAAVVALATAATAATAPAAGAGFTVGVVGTAVLHGNVVDDDPAAVAVLTVLGEDLDQAGAHALARHLDQAERGDLGDLVLGAVPAQALDHPA